MNEKSRIATTLGELIESHAIGVEKLSTLTEIPSRFITSLLNDEFSKLPPEPYVRGYLMKIARALKTDPDELVTVYKESAETAKSGANDKLPENRFRKAMAAKGWIIGLASIVLIGTFFLFRFNEIFGISSLEVAIPAVATSETLTVNGSIAPGDQLTINGEVVFTDEFGRFEKELVLAPGINRFEFRVKKFLGKEKTVIKEVYYEAPSAPSSEE